MAPKDKMDDLRQKTIDVAPHIKKEQQVFVSRHQPALFYNGQTIPLNGEREYILGRDRATCDIIINDARASRQHAKIFSRDGRYFIQDLGSLNGVFVNRERIRQPLGLLPGDEIVVPPKKLLFVLHDQQYQDKPERFVTSPGKPKSQFSGVLHALRIVDLIQLLNSTAQSGTLTIQDHERRPAKLQFVRGEIKSARYLDKTREEAVYALLTIRDGSFEFLREDIEMPPEPIETGTISMLLEGCRQADERPPELTPE